MNKAYDEIRTLCAFLEAEIDGRPYDRTEALNLATRLGQEFPEIANSVQQICQRIGGNLITAKAA